MSFTIGENCDLILVHPTIDGGDGHGFNLYNDKYRVNTSYLQLIEPNITILRDVDRSSGQVLYNVIIIALRIADNDQLPSGEISAYTEDYLRRMILEYCEMDEGVAIITRNGVYAGLISEEGNAGTETQFSQFSVIVIRLKGSPEKFRPFETDCFIKSKYVDRLETVGLTSLIWRKYIDRDNVPVDIKTNQAGIWRNNR